MNKKNKALKVKTPKILKEAKFSPFAIEIVKKLKQSGFQGYLVGGCVRDSLVGTLQQFEMSEAIAVSVKGVKSYADYRAISSVFDELGQLVDLRIDSLNGDTVIYRVVGVPSAEQVARLIPSRSGLLAQPVTRRGELELIWESF